MLNVAMNQLGTVYATKRRRRNGKSLKPPPKDGPTKSNPSKRHRERLNGELDTLASLLPFEQNILSKLDRLSILRLAVSYLRTKSYFQVSMIREKDENGHEYRSRDLTAYDHTPLDGELFLQALNGFLLILTCDGEVFFATHSIESYLGFHQSDIVHQSVYELVHSEDREELQRQLMWNAFLPPEYSTPGGGGASGGLQETLHSPEHAPFLERSFTVRFRCLLDNTSGFLRLDIRGRVKVLHGQNKKPIPSPEDPPLALFALCTPFGPPSLLEVPQKEVMFKSKHKLDLSFVNMDARGKHLLGYSDGELGSLGGYDLVHFEDLAYVCSAHQELLKTGASGLIAYRLQTKEAPGGGVGCAGRGNDNSPSAAVGGVAQTWQWLQTSSRLVYKNSKPDFIISTHRPLMEEEGRDLLGKRTMDFKVSYLDAGLTNSYFSDQDTMPLPSTPSGGSLSGGGGGSVTGSTGAPTAAAAAPKTRRYKTQLRDFLASCRTKRKTVAEDYNVAAVGAAVPVVVDPTVGVGGGSHASSFAAAYSSTSPYANCYGSPANYGVPDSYQQNFYPSSAYENSARYLSDSAAAATAASLFQYRTLGTYYPAAADYSPAAYVGVGMGNGFLDVSRGCLYGENQYKESSNCQIDYKSSSYGHTSSSGHHHSGGASKSSSKHIKMDPDAKSSSHGHSHAHGHGHSRSSHSTSSTPASSHSHDEYMMHAHYANTNGNGDSNSQAAAAAARQTVLMWGSSAAAAAAAAAGLGRHNSVIQPQGYEKSHKYGSGGGGGAADPLRSLSDMNSTGSGGSTPSTSSGGSAGSGSGSGSANHHDSKGLYLPPYSSGVGVGVGVSMGMEQAASEVWMPYPPPHAHAASAAAVAAGGPLHHSLVPDTYYHPTGAGSAVGLGATNRTEVLCCPSLR